MDSPKYIQRFSRKWCYFSVTTQLHFKVLGTALFKQQFSGCFRKVLCSRFHSGLFNLLKTEAYSKLTLIFNSCVLTAQVYVASSWIKDWATAASFLNSIALGCQTCLSDDRSQQAKLLLRTCFFLGFC